ncbi:hypothetical protein CF327_g2980 [Tilletia walkeri]|uniref:Uncharacterized protein n=1 Tax=Tilletia walkeri TaxID=117179 RepID=A0A8X7NAL4_9BASI|nr:hypothetical protein CF327_g2980 [Tilletia walkeri]KAE8270247.1 hypothetical protein A4X09_0g2082 [Tilletia walkeri]
MKTQKGDTIYLKTSSTPTSVSITCQRNLKDKSVKYKTSTYDHRLRRDSLKLADILVQSDYSNAVIHQEVPGKEQKSMKVDNSFQAARMVRGGNRFLVHRFKTNRPFQMPSLRRDDRW